MDQPVKRNLSWELPLAAGLFVGGLVIVAVFFSGVLGASTFGVGALVLGGVMIWAALVYFKILKYRSLRFAEWTRVQEGLHPAHPQPWTLRKEWQGEFIRADGLGWVWWLVGGVVAWDVLTWTATGALFASAGERPKPWTLLIFGVLGALFTVLLLHRIAQRIRWRGCRLMLATMPGVVGQTLEGVITVPSRLQPTEPVTLLIECWRRTTSRTRKGSHTAENVVWSHEEIVPLEKLTTSFAHAEISVRLAIPSGKPASDHQTRDSKVFWKLTASAPTAGVNFSTTFTIPVYSLPRIVG